MSFSYLKKMFILEKDNCQKILGEKGRKPEKKKVLSQKW